MHGDRPGPTPVERLRGVAPDDAEWRADAMAQSRHTRLEDILVEPTDDRDPQRAARICGEVARGGLRDFAPALVLLPPAQRRRVQALTAFALTLFDFARQSGLEGEKLSQINRWHFDLESTLDGGGPGQPVFVLLATTGRDDAWPRDALDALVGCARRRALQPRPDSEARAQSDALALGRALTAALVPASATDELEALVAALVRVARLLDLGDDQRRHQAGLAADTLPEAWATQGPLDAAALAATIREECARLRGLLARWPEGKPLPRPWRRALTYAVLAARRLVDRVDTLGAAALEERPQLGAWERIALLLRSRWLAL